MEVTNATPPNYDVIKAAFKLTGKEFFCYGDKIYNPNKLYLDPILVKHEEVHARQQGDDPDKWWNRYILDPSFRFCMELEAYQVQYKELKKLTKDRNKLFKWIDELARDLSGETYGNVCSYQEALRCIDSNIKFEV